MIGVGNMGSMISLLLAEHGIEVSIFDPSKASVQKTVEKANAAGLDARIHVQDDYKSLADSLGSPKVFLLSIPHGSTGDMVMRGLSPYMTKGDILIDGSNENYRVTERRQDLYRAQGIFYVGMGISGGYQGARHGPSLSPGGDDEALELLMPLFRMIAAKDGQGRSCVTKVGSGGSGHYVKMVHNGIEHGIMAAISEAWGIMNGTLKMTGDEIGAVFENWSSHGELVRKIRPTSRTVWSLVTSYVVIAGRLKISQENNFLVSISAHVCRAKYPGDGSYVLHNIRDNVVQDADDSEGTGVWANLEAIRQHIPTPTMTAAHQCRLASADAKQREDVKQIMLGGFPVEPIYLDDKEKQDFLEHLREAVYAASLASFIQGLNLLAKANSDADWGIDMLSVIRIWRAGCIIRSDHLSDLFERHYSQNMSADKNPLFGKEIAQELRMCYPSLKAVVIKVIEANAAVPTLSATLEYLKYCCSTDLPLSLMEAQMDYFGAHGFDLKSQLAGQIKKGMWIPLG